MIETEKFFKRSPIDQNQNEQMPFILLHINEISYTRKIVISRVY